MPVDPEKLRESYIKKAHAIMRLTPEKQEKAIKKLRQSLEAKKSHLEKLEREIELYKNKDIKGLQAYTRALQDEAGGNDDFKVPVSWDAEVNGLQTRLEEITVDYENLFEDNKTLLELEINDLDSQKAIIEPLQFENMIEHFGHKLVHKIADEDLKTIEKQINKEKAAIKKKIAKSVKALPENAEVPKAEIDKKIKVAQDLVINKRRKDLHGANLTEKNKARFTEIRENQLHSIDYRLGELQAEHRRLKRSKHEKKTD